MQDTQAQDEQAQDDRLVELHRRLEDEADRLLDEIRRLMDEARAYQGNENVVLACRREAKIARLEARVLEIGVIADEALEAKWSSSQPTGGTMSRRRTIRAGLERRRRNARSCYADAIRWRTLAARVARVAPRSLTPRTRAPRPRSRRTGSSSRTSGSDPGSSCGDGETEPPPPPGDSASALLRTAQLAEVGS